MKRSGAIVCGSVRENGDNAPAITRLSARSRCTIRENVARIAGYCAGSTSASIRAVGVPARAGEDSAEAQTVFSRKLLNAVASSTRSNSSCRWMYLSSSTGW